MFTMHQLKCYCIFLGRAHNPGACKAVRSSSQLMQALNDEEDGERGGNGGRDKDRKQRPRRVTEDFLPMHYTLVCPNTQTLLLSFLSLHIFISLVNLRFLTI